MTGVQAELGPHWGSVAWGLLQVCWGFNPSNRDLENP
jgi:hypothetical protein